MKQKNVIVLVVVLLVFVSLAFSKGRFTTVYYVNDSNGDCRAQIIGSLSGSAPLIHYDGMPHDGQCNSVGPIKYPE